MRQLPPYHGSPCATSPVRVTVPWDLRAGDCRWKPTSWHPILGCSGRTACPSRPLHAKGHHIVLLAPEVLAAAGTVAGSGFPQLRISGRWRDIISPHRANTRRWTDMMSVCLLFALMSFLILAPQVLGSRN